MPEFRSMLFTILGTGLIFMFGAIIDVQVLKSDVDKNRTTLQEINSKLEPIPAIKRDIEWIKKRMD